MISKTVNTLLEDVNNVKNQELKDTIRGSVKLVDAVLTYDNILREITKMSFTEESKSGKSISKFLVKLSEFLPKEYLKHMIYLQNHLDSQSYQIRVAMVEILANVIQKYLISDPSPAAGVQLRNFCNIIKERFGDVNQYVRIKVLQVLMKLTQKREGVSCIPKESRYEFVDLTIDRLRDKSSNVRKVAVKLLSELIETSPFNLYPPDDGKLSLSLFERRLKKFQIDLKNTFPEEIFDLGPKEDALEVKDTSSPPKKKIEISKLSDNEEIDQGTPEKRKNSGEGKKSNEFSESDDEFGNKSKDSEFENVPKIEHITQTKVNHYELTEGTEINPEATIDEIDIHRARTLQMGRNFLDYYSDAIKFVTQISSAIPTICMLVSSSHKAEVLEAMSFFVIAVRYGIEKAHIGINAMVHKIWDKETNSTGGDGEEGTSRTSVRLHLVDCYKMIYFEADLQEPGTKAWTESIVAKLLGLIQTMSLAELTSLEELLALMMEKKIIPKSIIDYLWKIFSSRSREFTHAKRRDALMLLRMFAKTNESIISEKLDMLVGIGLGEHGKSDLSLARECCIALQQLAPTKKDKDGFVPSYQRLEMNHILFQSLREIVLTPKLDNHWFGMAEQAINAIYTLGEHPDLICGNLIQTLAGGIFGVVSEADNIASQVEQMNIQNDDEVSKRGLVGSSMNADPFSEFTHCGAMELAQICFLVGHVAIKQLVHLETIEAEYKRRKALDIVDRLIPKTPSKTPMRTPLKTPLRNSIRPDELDQVVGTAEDEYAEQIAIVRERELLYGDDSLLTVFGPIVAFICSNNRSFDHNMLQIQAVLSLCKLMCVSSEFCDTNLQLLFTILEKSDNPIVRCNTLIGLGDMTVFFNSLIDQNISYLYARLSDTDITVRRNTLMVLTHLILNGQIKAKGQISEMAKCLEDTSSGEASGRIRDLARMFFTELSSKENAAVYNNLPDIISNLGHADKGVEEDDKQTENVVEKLCLRFRNAETERQWRDIAFCLSLVNYSSEKSVRKLMEALPHYKDKLGEENVFKYFQEIVGKAKKGISKLSNEMKQLLDEYMEKLLELQDLCLENAEAVQNATNIKKGIKSVARKKRENVEQKFSESGQSENDEELEESMSKMNLAEVKAIKQEKVLKSTLRVKAESSSRGKKSANSTPSKKPVKKIKPRENNSESEEEEKIQKSRKGKTVVFESDEDEVIIPVKRERGTRLR
ncbi:Condensin complex subunit [Nowakowskiella sp. JEL0078]|nr:Condensin complex subunit [Nowakowskiella sp. JEL0078]